MTNLHPDPGALAARLCAAAGLEPGSLILSRADVEALISAAFGLGVHAGIAEIAGDRACRICGCTQYRACPGGCGWVGPDLCSACAPYVTTAGATS